MRLAVLCNAALPSRTLLTLARFVSEKCLIYRASCRTSQNLLTSQDSRSACLNLYIPISSIHLSLFIYDPITHVLRNAFSCGFCSNQKRLEDAMMLLYLECVAKRMEINRALFFKYLYIQNKNTWACLFILRVWFKNKRPKLDCKWKIFFACSLLPLGQDSLGKEFFPS